MQNDLFDEQVVDLLSALDADYPAPIVPTNEQLATYLVSWLLQKMVMEQNFIGLDAMIDVAKAWLADREAGL